MLREILSWRPNYKPALDLIEQYLTEKLEEESIIDIYDKIPEESMDAELLLRKARILRRIKKTIRGMESVEKSREDRWQ